MKVSDILRVKGGTLFTTQPDKTLAEAAGQMAQLDVGSLVVLEDGKLVGMLTFREVIAATVQHGGSLNGLGVGAVMDAAPMTCGPDTDLDEVRRMMLQRHARYMPILEASKLVGVVSFYDVAKAVVESQDFENRMLKAYIRDWPSEETGSAAA